MAVFRVERNTGYTVMSNHHLRNKELSLKAKGLLSQMLSLPEDWDYTLAGLSYINRESIDAIRTAVWELEKAGYITRRQGRDEKGKMTAIEYTIYEQPQPPELDCPVLENPTADNPILENPTTDNPTSENPMQLNKDISRTNLPKKEKSNTDLSITHSIPIHSLNPLPYGEDEAAQPPERKRTERNDAYRVYEEIIKDNIAYDILLQDRSLDRDRLNEIVDLMLETVCTARKKIRIAGDDYPAELVKSKFMKLNSEHIRFGIVTVFIAAHSPAKQAAKVSPVAAVSGNTGTSKHGGCAAKSGVFKIETSLGIHHATEAKKNLFLITGSFALTIALFLSFAACLDLVHKLLPSVSDFTPDIVISSEDETNSVDRNLAEDISEIPGVKSVFGTKLHVAYPVEINGNAGTVDLFSYDESMLDSFKKSVMSGDLSKVYGNSGYALAIYNQDNRLNVGDKIKIGDTEIEIACIASEGVGSVSGAATMVCSEETYTQLTGEQDYALVSVVLEKNISETEVSKIRNLSSDYVFADNRAENSDVNGSYWVFRLAAYGFLAIISFITILNIMNSISMSVSARIKQYGAMRAVGMGNRQITKMITAEAITYAACGTIIGFVLGLLLHYLIYVKIIVTHFGGTWKVPVVPMEIIVLLVLVSCILAVYAPAKRIRNMAITATINEL